MRFYRFREMWKRGSINQAQEMPRHPLIRRRGCRVSCTAMDHPELFVPDPALAEEWDNPEMTAFKWQEAEDRVAFAKSHTQGEWLAAMKSSMLPDGPIQVAPQPRDRFPVKVIRLPW